MSIVCIRGKNIKILDSIRGANPSRSGWKGMEILLSSFEEAQNSTSESASCISWSEYNSVQRICAGNLSKTQEIHSMLYRRSKALTGGKMDSECQKWDEI